MQHAHIRQLSAEVIGQIAAGEVVERPAAAIKELVENSMDAGATAITVEIRDGGLTSFRVVDNGSGIPPSDIRMAFARHATSKITTTDDLYGVQTLGFRGEALASIAAVSKVTCISRLHGAENGVSLVNIGGEIGEIKEAACPEGTSFTVKDLFFNAPVRRKFLKKPSTETGYISDLMMRLILSHPQISFRYIADGKSIYFSAGDGKLESAVMSIYGLRTLEQMRFVSGNMNGVLLEGYVGIGDLMRGNRSHQSFILNGRLIKSNLLSNALEEACKQRVMIGKFPMCVLHLTMPFESADVNVHPNKWEVRFQNEAAVREAVQTLVFEALQGDSPLDAPSQLFEQPQTPPPARIQQTSPQEYTAAAVQRTVEDNTRPDSGSKIPDSKIIEHNSASSLPDSGFSAPHYGAMSSGNHAGFTARSDGVSVLPPADYSQSAFIQNTFSKDLPVGAPSESVPPMPHAQPQPVPFKSEDSSTVQVEQTTAAPFEEQFNALPVRLIGSVFDTYILLECADRLLLCDQHAVHERLLYEQYLRDSAGDAATQMLLTPEIVHLTHREYAVFEESREALLAAGFDASDFGDLTVQLRSIPMMLGQARSADCFLDALDELAESGQITNQRRTDRIIQMACKHAVKGGERAPMEALMELIRRMIRENVTPTCPHGRPLVIEVTRRDLEKRFHRIQN